MIGLCLLKVFNLECVNLKVFLLNVCLPESFQNRLPGGFRPSQGQSGQSLAPPASLGKPSEHVAAAVAAADAPGKTAADASLLAESLTVLGGKICIQLQSSSPCKSLLQRTLYKKVP